MLLLPDFRVRQREYLLEISRAMTAQLDLGELLRLVLQASVTMLAGEVGLIALYEEAEERLRIRALIGASPEHVPVFDPLLEGVTTESFNVPEFDLKLRRVAQALGLPLRQAIALPMHMAQDFIGMIYIFRAFSGTATMNDRRVLQSFADQAAIAVHNAGLYEAVNRERQRLARILNYSADGVMILDAKGIIQRFNRAMSRISGWSADAVVGRPYDVVLSWASRPQGTGLAEATQAGWPWAYRDSASSDSLYVQGDLLRPDGTTISVGVTYAPLLDEEERLINIIVNVNDITHFRKAQEMQSTFISVISHELKTPVALIKGYAGTLRREDANWDPKVVEQSLGVIEEEADRLADLIENLLAASKLQAEAMRLKLSDVSVAEIARSAVARFRTQTDKHDFVLDFPDDFPVILGDEERLRQVIDNLLSNAIKYSPHGGAIRVSGTCTDAEVRVEVQDEGIGLPQDEWDRVFERFYRVDDALTSKTKGTGLGLYLSRAVVEAHGGQIGVHSQPGHGSTFYFTLPRHPVGPYRNRSGS